MNTIPQSLETSAVLTHPRLGALRIFADQVGLTRVLYLSCRDAQADDPSCLSGVLRQAFEQLNAYLTGEIRTFTVPINWSGIADFQEQVLRAAIDIPCGQTKTYGEIAIQIGHPGAARAVGVALGRNPMPIIIPCHRVTAANGRMQGYTAPDGIATKLWLLQHEGAILRV